MARTIEPAPAGLALSAGGLAAAISSLAVGAPEIWTVLNVEAASCGFLPDRRPAILFERHIFSRLTHGRFDISDISNPLPGGYGSPGANQYERLEAAMRSDRLAALQSASWGLAQILGCNFGASGFRDAEAMVSAMKTSEDAQLAAFASFLRNAGLHQVLKAHDWTAFARGYNGPNFAINRYDTKLAQAFQKYSCGPAPDLDVRAAQLYLTFAGFDPGPVDGMPGPKTRTALRAFQQRKNLQITGESDRATLAALLPDAKCGEDAIQNIVGGGGAGDGVNRTERPVEIQQ